MKAECNMYLRKPNEWWSNKLAWCTWYGEELLCKSGLARKLEIPTGTKKLVIVFSSAKPRHQNYWEISCKTGKRWSYNVLDYVTVRSYNVNDYRGTLMFPAELLLQDAAEKGAKYVWFEVDA